MDLNFFHKILSVDSTSGKEAELADILSVELAAPGRKIDIFEVGEYIVYVNGDRYEIGKVKSLREDGAFVYYHEGDTAAKTPYDCMHKLINGYTIKKSTLGGTT